MLPGPNREAHLDVYLFFLFCRKNRFIIRPVGSLRG